MRDILLCCACSSRATKQVTTQNFHGRTATHLIHQFHLHPFFQSKQRTSLFLLFLTLVIFSLWSQLHLSYLQTKTQTNIMFRSWEWHGLGWLGTELVWYRMRSPQPDRTLFTIVIIIVIKARKEPGFVLISFIALQPGR